MCDNASQALLRNMETSEIDNSYEEQKKDKH